MDPVATVREDVQELRQRYDNIDEPFQSVVPGSESGEDAQKSLSVTATATAPGMTTLRVEAKPYDPLNAIVVGNAHVVVGGRMPQQQQQQQFMRPQASAGGADDPEEKRYPQRLMRHQDPVFQIQKAALDLQAGFRTGGPRERMLLMRPDAPPSSAVLVGSRPAYAPPTFDIAMESLATGSLPHASPLPGPVPAAAVQGLLMHDYPPSVTKPALQTALQASGEADPLDSLVNQLVGLEGPKVVMEPVAPPPPPPPPPPQEPMAPARQDAGAIARKPMPTVTVIPHAFQRTPHVIQPQIGLAPNQYQQQHQENVASTVISKPSPQPSSWVPSLSAKPWTPSVAAKPWTPPAAFASPPPPPPSYSSAHTSPGLSTPAMSVPSLQSTPQHMADNDDVVAAHQTLRVDMDKFFSSEAPPVVVHETQTHLQSLQGVRANMPTVPITAWYPVHFLGSEVYLPAPFQPEGGGQHQPEHERPHFVTSRPSTHPNVKLLLVYYQCFRCVPNVFPGRLETRPPDLKLGGICGDVPALCIAHLIKIVTNIDLLAIDMFGHTVGRCNLWVKDQNDARTLLKMLDKSIWMSPIPYGYAVVAPDDAAKEYLLWYLEGLRNHGPKSTRFPRHLMTCERWIV